MPVADSHVPIHCYTLSRGTSGRHSIIFCDRAVRKKRLKCMRLHDPLTCAYLVMLQSSFRCKSVMQRLSLPSRLVPESCCPDHLSAHSRIRACPSSELILKVPAVQLASVREGLAQLECGTAPRSLQWIKHAARSRASWRQAPAWLHNVAPQWAL